MRRGNLTPIKCPQCPLMRLCRASEGRLKPSARALEPVSGSDKRSVIIIFTRNAVMFSSQLHAKAAALHVACFIAVII